MTSTAPLSDPSAISLPANSSWPLRGREELPRVVLPPAPPVVENDGVLNCAGDDNEESAVASKERRDNSEGKGMRMLKMTQYNDIEHLQGRSGCKRWRLSCAAWD